MVKKLIDIPQELWDNIKIQAIREHKTVNQIVEIKLKCKEQI